MKRFLIRRLLFFPITLFVISLLAFIISINAPGDPLDIVMNASSNSADGSKAMNENQTSQKEFWRKKLGLDLPVFYIGIKSFAEPDTLYKVAETEERTALERLIDQYGNWDNISKYYLSIKDLDDALSSLNKSDTIPSNAIKSSEIELNDAQYNLHILRTSYNDLIISNTIEKLNSFFKSSHQITKQFEEMKMDYSNIKSSTTKWKKHIPTFAFYGFNNQFNRWLFGDECSGSKGLIRGDFGTSYTTKQPVSEIIYNRLGWTLFFSFTSIFLAYFISIPIGIKAASHKGKLFDRISSLILFLLFSMPVFWMATLLLMTFANPDVLKIFKASGVAPAEGFEEGLSLFGKIMASIPYLVLPTICYTYSSLAFLSRQMREPMIEALSQDYIRTARAKGLSEKVILYKHAFRNSLFPILNLFATLFPAIISGSIILEAIFSIPGMGTETIAAIEAKNYPMIVAIFTLTGFLTITGFLISDVLFKVIDPRIDYEK